MKYPAAVAQDRLKVGEHLGRIGPVSRGAERHEAGSRPRPDGDAMSRRRGKAEMYRAGLPSNQLLFKTCLIIPNPSNSHNFELTADSLLLVGGAATVPKDSLSNAMVQLP